MSDAETWRGMGHLDEQMLIVEPRINHEWWDEIPEDVCMPRHPGVGARAIEAG